MQAEQQRHRAAARLAACVHGLAASRRPARCRLPRAPAGRRSRSASAASPRAPARSQETHGHERQERQRRQADRDQGRRRRRGLPGPAARDLLRAPDRAPGGRRTSSRRSSSTSATTASARSRWTRPTGSPAAIDVVDTGSPISVPVGDVTLGRLWNVLGDPIDEKDRCRPDDRALADPPRPAGLRRALAEDRDLRDRDQGRRPDRPVRARRQDRPLRRRRRRQDGADPGADREPRPRARRRLGLLRRRRAHARGQRPLARDEPSRGE